jgi:flagellar hook protein FlgE
MSIYGAMFSGVSGLNAQSQALAMISDNISNVNTVGYKTSKAYFSTLVTGQTQNNYAPGGVRSTPLYSIDRQGLVQASANQTDMAISGQGFFVVTAQPNPTSADVRYYTRAGSFQPDASGYLRTPTGFYLQGWATDSAGVPTSANPSDIATLVPVRVNTVSGSARPTSILDLGLNLPASAAAGDNFTTNQAHTGGMAADGISSVLYDSSVASGDAFRYSYNGGAESFTLTDLTTGATQTVNITAALDAVAGAGSDLGAGQTATVDFDTLGVQFTLSGSAGFTRATNLTTGALNTAGLAAGSTMTGGAVTLPSSGINDATITALTAAGAYSPATGLLTIPVVSSGAGNEHINPAAGLKFSVDGGAVAADVSATDLDDGAAHSVGVYVNDGASDVLVGTLNFASLASTGAGAGSVTVDLGSGLTSETSTPSGAAETTLLQVYDSLGVAHDVTLTWNKNTANDWTVTASVAGATTVDEGAVGAGAGYSVNVLFNGDGTPASFDGAATPPALAIGGWTSGANDSVISINLGTPDTANGVTQFASAYSTTFINQDGAQFGNFFGVSVDEQGIITALFDNGQSLKVYKLPVATFANPDGLTGKTGSLFLESSESGGVVLRDAGTANAGKLVPSSLEASTTDLATEFTNMIVTQQAYSASAKVITTADDMLSELMRVKR